MSNLPPSHLLPQAASRAFAPARVSASLPAIAPGIRARLAGVFSSYFATVVLSGGSRSAPAVAAYGRLGALANAVQAGSLGGLAGHVSACGAGTFVRGPTLAPPDAHEAARR
jgi:hypothetical protein